MKKESYLISVVFTVIFILTIIFFYWFFKSPYFPVVDAWIKKNLIIYIVVLYIYKSFGVLWPPIPAGLITLASIPFLGWFNAYLIDLVGSISGGMIAYHLGKRFGRPLLLKILNKEIVAKIERAKIKKNREIEAIFTYRVLLGSTILEAVYYGAGFLKIGFFNFIFGSVLSHVVVGIPSFYFAHNIFSGKNFLMTVALSIFALLFVYKTRGRYFE